MFYHTLLWVSFFLERELQDKGSTDALKCAPVPRGDKRARRLDPLLLAAISAEAGSGRVCHTGRKVVAMLHRFRVMPREVLEERTGSTLDAKSVLQYLEAGQAFWRGEEWHTVSLAMDATRVGGRDTLFSCLFDPLRKVGCWAPPLAPSPETNARPNRLTGRCRANPLVFPLSQRPAAFRRVRPPAAGRNAHATKTRHRHAQKAAPCKNSWAPCCAA